MNDANALGQARLCDRPELQSGAATSSVVPRACRLGGYTVVGDIIHDVNKIQDFAPYVAKIKEAAPDTVITGSWSSDLLQR